MDQYRKILLDSYAFMFFARLSYIHLGFEICLLDELKELNGYMENETFQMDILGTMEDRAVTPHTPVRNRIGCTDGKTI